jgi:hypothetical protein
VSGWFLICPPVAFQILIAGLNPLVMDAPQCFIVALGSAVGYDVLRGRDAPVTA